MSYSKINELKKDLSKFYNKNEKIYKNKKLIDISKKLDKLIIKKIMGE